MSPEDTILSGIGSPGEPTEQQREAARKVVCLHSADAREAHTLLSMLGLL